MNLSATIRDFLTSEDGMVTVEWVAMSAAVTIGGILIAWAVLDSMDPTAAKIGATHSGVLPASSPTSPAFGDGKTGG